MILSRKPNAFTIVELLIVIVVIAILAAISIVAYNGIQDRARISSTTSALAQAKKKIAIWQVDNPNTTPPDLATVGVTNSGDVTNYYSPGSNGSYCITSVNGSATYRISDTSAPEQGGCTITNSMPNPSAETNTTFWGQNNATVVRSGEQAYSGGFSFKITPSTTATYSGMLMGDSGINGQRYTYSAYVYSTATQQINFAADGAGVNASPSVGPNWQRIVVSGTKVNGNPIHVRAVSTAGIPFYVDGIMVTQGPSTFNYADGASVGWTWSGTAHNSASSGPAS